MAVRLQGFEVDAHLDRNPARRSDRHLRQSQIPQRFTQRNPDLRLDQIDPIDRLGHRMFDLQSRIGFDKDKALRILAIEQEFKGGKALEFGTACHPHRSLDHLLAHVSWEAGTGCDLDQLLLPALQAALAFAKLAHSAGPIAQDLDLDVTGIVEEFLGIEVAPTEGGQGLGLAQRVGLVDLISARHDPQPPPSAPGNGFDHQGAGLERRGPTIVHAR